MPLTIAGSTAKQWEAMFRSPEFWDGFDDRDDARLEREAIAALASKEVAARRAAAYLLGKDGMSPLGIAALVRALGDPDVTVVVRAIGSVEDREIVPHLPALFAHPNKEVRARACESAGRVARYGGDKGHVGLVIARLDDRAAEVRAAALAALVELGEVASTAAPRIEALLADAATRVDAARALVAIGARRSLLEHILGDRALRGGAFAVYSSGERPPLPVQLIPYAVDALTDRDPWVVRSAINALCEIGEAIGPDASLALGELLVHPDDGVVRTAIAGLVACGPHAIAALPRLAAALETDRAFLIEKILIAIGAPAIPIARAALTHPAERTREAAREILAAVGGERY